MIENNNEKEKVTKRPMNKVTYTVMICLITSLITALLMTGAGLTVLNEIDEYFVENLGFDLAHILKVTTVCQEVGINNADDKANTTDLMLVGYVQSLKDKYASYVPRTMSQQFSMLTEGEYVGIGIIYSKKQNEVNEFLEITDVSKNSPAEKAGLVVGDKIYKMNDIDVINEEAINNLLTQVREQKLKEVKVNINNEKDVIIKIEKIEIPLTEFKIEDNIAKISVSSFNERSKNEFISYIEEAEKANVKGYLIDLRDNAGGEKNSALEMMERMCKEGLLMKEVDKYNNITNAYYAKDKKYIDKPVVIMTNNNTASASELFSMGLQDLNGAKTVGQTTFGKSTVLASLTFENGSSIVISSGYYYPQSERYIEGIGIEPDYPTEIGEEETKALEVLNELINQN